MTRKSLGLVASVGLVTLLYAPSPASAQAVSPSLGSAGSYSILAGGTVTNTGATTISGNVGISPGIGGVPHFTGFGTVVFTGGGAVHDADASAASAVAASFPPTAGNAFGALDQGCNTTYAGANKQLGGESLGPGVYCASEFLLNGTLTLVGAAADTWIFKSARDLIITGGAAAKVVSPSCNVWWRLVRTATFDAGGSLTGNILADTSITLAAGASLSGRAFARTAEVTLSSNAISACVVPLAPPSGVVARPTIAKAFTPDVIQVGGVSRLVIQLNNANAAAISLTSAFTDTLPTGVVVAASPAASTTCGAGSVAAAVGGSTVTLSAGSTIPGAASCSVSVNVTAAAAGSFLNTIAAGALVTNAGSNAAPTSSPLTSVTVLPPVAAPTPTPTPAACPVGGTEIFIVKRHTEAFVVGTNATYSIALFNGGTVASSGTITVVDTLPAGLTFVSATGTGWTCSAAGQIVTCTSTTAAAGVSPSPNSITLTVTPTAAAVPGVTNTATVVGGGDCDVTNNATADVTLVTVPAPIPVPTLSQWAFIMLAMLLAAAGILAMRSRRA